MTERAKILVLCEEEATADKLKKHLQQSGYKITLLSDSAEKAKAAFNEAPVDLIIIVVDDPQQKEGIALAEHAYKCLGIPSVIIASFLNLAFLTEAKQAGAFGYLIKPYQPAALIATIEITLHRSAMEKTLKEPEEDFEMFRLAVENSNIAICIMDKEEFEYVNPAFETLIGYSGEELKRNKASFKDLMLPEDKPLFEAINAAREKSEVIAPWFEFKIITAYQEIKNVEAMLTDMKVREKRKILGIIRDITERKRMEEMIRSSEEYYKGMFDSAHDAILLFSPENEIVIDANPSACTMYGYSREEFEGMSLETISKNVARGKLQVEETLKKGMHHNFETVQYRKDGSEIPLEVNASVLTINNNRVILSINRDISKRKKLEEELQLNLTKAGHSLEGMIRTITIILEKRDPYSAGHHKRVANLAYAMAQKLKFPEHKAEGIRIAGLIHDIGKLNVPQDILLKPCKLNKYEWDIIKTHPRAAYDILKGIEFPWPIADIVYQHHEKLDGSGYPLGLKGDKILLEARTLVLANVVEAMLSDRPYRPALPLQKVMDEITRQKDILYDAMAVEACIQLMLNEDFHP